MSFEKVLYYMALCAPLKGPMWTHIALYRSGCSLTSGPCESRVPVTKILARRVLYMSDGKHGNLGKTLEKTKSSNNNNNSEKLRSAKEKHGKTTKSYLLHFLYVFLMMCHGPIGNAKLSSTLFFNSIFSVAHILFITCLNELV